MKWKLSKNQITWGLTLFLVVVACIVFYSVFYRSRAIGGALRSVFSSIIIVVYGVVIAYVLSPVLGFLEKHLLRPVYRRFGVEIDHEKTPRKFREMRRISVLLTMALTLLLLYLMLQTILPQIIRSITEISRNFPRYVSNVNALVGRTLAEQPQLQTFTLMITERFSDIINEYLNGTVMPFIRTISTQMIARVWDAARGIFNFFIGMIVAVYLLNAKETFAGGAKKLAYAFLREDLANELVSAFRFTHYTFTGFITGKLLDSAIVGIICYIGMRLLKLPYPVLISVAVGVTNILPFFGPYIGGIAGGLLLVMVRPVSALVFIIFVVLLQQLDGNIIGPRILGDSTGLPSFWVIFAILFFGGLWGVVGWFIGVPIFAVIYAFTGRLTSYLLARKGLPTEDETYVSLAYVEEAGIRRLDDPAADAYNAKPPGSNWKRLLRIGKSREAYTEKDPATNVEDYAQRHTEEHTEQ